MLKLRNITTKNTRTFQNLTRLFSQSSINWMEQVTVERIEDKNTFSIHDKNDIKKSLGHSEPLQKVAKEDYFESSMQRMYKSVSQAVLRRKRIRSNL